MADDPVTKKLDGLYRDAKSAKRLLEPVWLMNHAYYQGRQWLSFAGDRLQEPKLDGNRLTIVEDRIAGCVRTELAKMTKNRPVFTVTPNTGDEEDANASDIGERLMRYLWRHLKMPEMSLKALEWSRICSAGFLKCYWDGTIGDPIELLIGPDGNIVDDPQNKGKPMHGDKQAAAQFSQALGWDGNGPQPVRSKQVAMGDIRVEVRSPFQMFVDPICDSFPEAEWVIEESIKSKEYALRRYGVKLDADTPANPGLIESRLTGGHPGAQNSYKGVKLREYWCKPCTDYPNGVRIVWSQGKVLDRDDRPFDCQPYVMLTGIPVPGRLWPMSVVELLRGPQTELNKTLSQMAENRNRIGNPTVIASRTAVQDPEQFQSSIMVPGGVFYRDPAWGPDPGISYLEAPPLPQYVTDTVQRCIAAIEDISGQHEVTNANVPPGVTAASAISLLQEADDTRLGLGTQDYEEQLGRFGSKLLDLAANFYSDARTIKIAGDDGAWEIFDFKGAMLKGNTHVEVQAGSAFPQSKAQKQAMLQDNFNMLVQSGNAPHGRQLAQFYRDQGMGAYDRLVAEYTVSETQANRENVRLSLGIPLPINEYDDDDVHVAAHEDFERSTRFQTFGQQIQQIHLQHTALHKQRQQQQQQQQLQMQLQMEGKVDPSTSTAALQAEHELSQLQGQQEMQGTAQQQQGQAQQQGYDAAGAEQKQRQDAEAHQQMLHHKQQAHEAQMQLQQQQREHQAEQHQARLQQMKQQANRSQGARDGR